MSMTNRKDQVQPSGQADSLAVREYGLSLAVLLLAVTVCFVMRSRLNPTDVAMVLLLADVFVASRYRQGPTDRNGPYPGKWRLPAGVRAG